MVDPTKVQVDDLMCFVYWAKVRRNDIIGFRGQHALAVRGIDGKDFEVQGNKLIEDAFSADRYNKEEKVTHTEIAEKLIGAVNRPFTVVFAKANGDIRKLRGRFLRHEALMGRSYVEDLDVVKGSPLRQVDHRNIQELIVDNVKYVVKK